MAETNDCVAYYSTTDDKREYYRERYHQAQRPGHVVISIDIIAPMSVRKRTTERKDKTKILKVTLAIT